MKTFNKFVQFIKHCNDNNIRILFDNYIIRNEYHYNCYEDDHEDVIFDDNHNVYLNDFIWFKLRVKVITDENSIPRNITLHQENMKPISYSITYEKCFYKKIEPSEVKDIINKK